MLVAEDELEIVALSLANNLRFNICVEGCIGKVDISGANVCEDWRISNVGVVALYLEGQVLEANGDPVDVITENNATGARVDRGLANFEVIELKGDVQLIVQNW